MTALRILTERNQLVEPDDVPFWFTHVVSVKSTEYLCFFFPVLYLGSIFFFLLSRNSSQPGSDRGATGYPGAPYWYLVSQTF